jgi:glycosyltransferase involved in cell wall biosynthesis
VAQVTNIYLGCGDQVFYPRPNEQPEGEFRVFTYCTYLPLHGIDTVVKAAALCQGLPIRFCIVGDNGPVYQRVRNVADQLQLSNLEFAPSIPFAQLPREIALSTVCLGGHFGATAKAGRVIAGKTYQFMAMAKPVILGDNPANRELFQHGRDAYFCPPNEPEALATAICDLYRQPELRQTLANNAFQLFQERLNWRVLGGQLRAVVEGMV